ncbi:DUF6701 domain-containing protein [Simiduia aestuariiviva]|uniref:DUF6701 domain-containing protein n=1 Tax=Simiduia aestuariiviva TaxID=1510459 RepID=A0A839UM26_9GAMM|nr:DUF6701 domain-containing protein [Simiduia aestuariiviva]MBB3168753.1 hypothetical protein [Simiduia aestuariiviva]
MRTHPCPFSATLGSFQIDVGGGVASVCAAKEISITAFDTNGAVLADYSGTVSISTSTAHGDWSATEGGTPSGDPPTNALAPGANDSGAAGYTFAGVNDGGAIAVFLNNQHAEQLTITVSDATAGVSTTSSLLGFSENAFDIQNTDALAADIVGGRDHNFRIDMWRRDPSSGDCSVATNYNVGAIKMWVTRVIPDDPSGAAPSVRTGSGVFGLPNSSPASANVTFPFVAGTANFELLTTDVGKYRIDVSDDASGFSDQAILGATSTLIVRPFALDIQAAGNPAGVTATGPAFIPAGQNFNVTARAVLWSASDDGNDDGIADGHADGNPSTGAILSDNTVAASFGQESPTEGVQLSATLIAPLGGADPGLGNGDSPSDGRQIASFSSGVGTSGNVFFAEVGAIEINSLVLDGDYLAMGSARTQKIIGSSYVGRFYPASFALTAGSVTEACDTFSYMEQPFVADYQLTALNGRPAPTTTTNYAGAFAKLGGGSGTFNYGARGNAQDLSARLAGLVTTVSWSAGVGSVVLDPVTFTRQLSTAPDGPITDLALGVIPQDTDGVTLATASLDLDVDGDSVDDHGLLGGSIQRYGRLRAKDAFGPESASIPMFWQTEYYNGAQFVRATDDNCSQLAFSQINFVGATTSVNAGAQTVTVSQGGVDSVFDFSDPLGSQTCMTASEVGFCQGFAGVAYGATGVTGSYPVEVNLANYPHLRFDWDGDGNYGDTQLPRFTINFENYRGHDRIIFWRERL